MTLDDDIYNPVDRGDNTVLTGQRGLFGKLVFRSTSPLHQRLMHWGRVGSTSLHPSVRHETELCPWYCGGKAVAANRSSL